MSITSLNELLPLINQQIELQETLSHQIFKVKALIDVAISGDFLDNPRDTIQFYLFAMSDMIESSQKLSEDILKFFQKNFPAFPLKVNLDESINL